MEAFFLPVPPGQRLCVLHPAEGGTRARIGGVLYVHPFGDEMNKSRRMASLQARALAQAGFDVLLMDLFGCGDSSGDFGDATWEIWQDDVDAAGQWLATRVGRPAWVWGLRTGALLAASAAARSGGSAPMLLWQPTASGHRFVQQYLRARVMSDALAEGRAKTTMASLFAELGQGNAIEVAGYTLSPALVMPIDRAVMPSLPTGSVVRWVEVIDAADAAIGSSAADLVAAWRSNGVDVTATVVECPQFWQTQDIAECPRLIQCTTGLLSH